MSNLLVYNYTIIRFMPCDVGGEFINIGIVINFPQTGKIDYKINNLNHCARLNSFFPEFKGENSRIYIEAVKAIRKSFEKNKKKCVYLRRDNSQLVFDDIAGECNKIFSKMILATESIITFSKVRSGVTPDPDNILNVLFSRYVARKVDPEEDFTTRMKRRLEDFIVQLDLDEKYERDAKVGNNIYHIIVPFASIRNKQVIKVIKPMDFCGNDVSASCDKAVYWAGRLSSLKKSGVITGRTCIIANSPKNRSQNESDAMDFIKDLFNGVGGEIIDSTNDDAVKSAIIID